MEVIHLSYGAYHLELNFLKILACYRINLYLVNSILLDKISA